METLESSRMCRLCGQHSGIAVNIFDENENHVRKINATLPIMVHEMDLLPKQMCHRCSYKLEEFHKFYVNCLKTDAALKSQLSWMRKGGGKEKIDMPMVHIENIKIKTEPLDYDMYKLEPLVENIDYINSINSMAFPAKDIHDGLTYTTFSRCRCYCDKQGQNGRTMAKIRQNYERPIPKSSSTITNATPKSTFKNRLRPRRRRNVFSQTVFPDCPQSYLSRAVRDAQNRLATINLDVKSDVSSAKTRNHSYDKLDKLSENRAISTIARNLRPRKNVVNYAPSRKKTSDIVQQFTENIFDPKEITNFQLQPNRIKEQMDEFKECTRLRPRKSAVDYQESKNRKRASREDSKIDDVGQQSSTLHSNKNKEVSDIAQLKIKQEVLDDLHEHAVETSSATTPLQNKPTDIVDLLMKIETSDDIDDNACLRKNTMSDFNSKRSREKHLSTKKKIYSNILRNQLAKTKKTNQFSAENYSPKCLRSQNTYLRNGKTRRNDYVEWSVKRLQTRKLIDAINKRTKEPPMLKLPESIKHYCDTCNVSFINKELFRLHVCY